MNALYALIKVIKDRVYFKGYPLFLYFVVCKLARSFEDSLDSKVASFNETYFPDFDKVMQMDSDTNDRWQVIENSCLDFYVVRNYDMSLSIVIVKWCYFNIHYFFDTNTMYTRIKWWLNQAPNWFYWLHINSSWQTIYRASEIRF